MRNPAITDCALAAITGSRGPPLPLAIGSGCLPAYLFDVVIRNQTLGFILVLSFCLLLGLPPVILGALFQDVEQITLADFQFTLSLRLVIVHGRVDTEEPHGGREVWTPIGRFQIVAAISSAPGGRRRGGVSGGIGDFGEVVFVGDEAGVMTPLPGSTLAQSPKCARGSGDQE